MFEAIERASGGPVEEGSVGAGTGMSAFGFKGGIGTSSRRFGADAGGWTVGVLVLANFGQKRQLRIDGVPIGQILDTNESPEPERGSIMIIVATDAPLLDRQLSRIAKRAVLGMARTGSTGGNGSGDVVIAFSTADSVRVLLESPDSIRRIEMVSESGPGGSSDVIDRLFAATVEATEEAIINRSLHGDHRCRSGRSCQGSAAARSNPAHPAKRGSGREIIIGTRENVS